MSSKLKLDQLQSALQVSDPKLVELIILLSQQIETSKTPQRQGSDNFERFLDEITTSDFRKKPADEQWAFRTERLKALESDQAEVPLTQCLRLHEILFALYERKDSFSRWCLLQVIPQINLTYGPWRALKSIFKQAETANDTELYGALAARFDQALASGDHNISRNTLVYLTHRAWRVLRRTGETLPAMYPDMACDILAHYDDETAWSNSWIANHIFYHDGGQYNRTRFTFRSRPGSLLKYRAFSDSWHLTPRPLLSLLERARSEQVRRYACDALKTDFRSTLRDVEPQWIIRLIGAKSATIDDFVIWLLDNVPRFEQAEFRQLGMHDSILALFGSPSDNARMYAATYARTHARDLSVQGLMHLLNNHHKAVRALALDLLRALDPRKDVGLDAWGGILETRYGCEFASAVLLKHFSKRELTPAWFALRLLQPGSHGFDFASANLLQQHSEKALGANYFCDLLIQIDYKVGESRKTVDFACQHLSAFDLNDLDIDFLKMLLINPATFSYLHDWVGRGLLKPQNLDVAFLKVVVFHPTWEQDSWVHNLKQTQAWANNLQFSAELAGEILNWLADIRHFSPDQLSFDWLMTLVQRSEPLYHDFAVEVMNKAFLPADFAPVSKGDCDTEVISADVEINVDFGGDSFVFTGKLAKMTRSEAQKKVTSAGGSNASGVTKKLNWLVIGDEGSSLYGEGRKGSKQLKGEKLIADGAGLRIISETAFLQMLSGEQREFSDDVVEAGCLRLWDMLSAENTEDAPLTLFALSYIRSHHQGICLAETDRPVDPGSEIPDDFLNFKRCESLFNDSRVRVRDFALELAHWEFARWQPPIESVVVLSESAYPEVRTFIAKALTVDDEHEHQRYRIDPQLLTADAVYGFCESANDSARELGMLLIDRHPRLQLPQELFRLSESPDRAIRGFVIRRFWHWYRDRAVTADWQPTVKMAKPTEKAGSNAHKQYAQALGKVGCGGVVKPDVLPASYDSLQQFLRRILFEVAPGRLPREDGKSSTSNNNNANTQKSTRRLKALPTRQSKLNLIETLRDLAIDDIEFARYVLPLLLEFKGSRGKSEHAACLVSVTRIKATHSELASEYAGAPA